MTLRSLLPDRTALEPNSNLYEVKQRWVSGDASDCWVNPGDIVYRLETIPSGVDKSKVS